MSPEQLALAVQDKHGLRSLHIFAQDDVWRVFGARGTQAFSASVEEGRGATIAAAIENLDQRITAGPIKAGQLPPPPARA